MAASVRGLARLAPRAKSALSRCAWETVGCDDGLMGRTCQLVAVCLSVGVAWGCGAGEGADQEGPSATPDESRRLFSVQPGIEPPEQQPSLAAGNLVTQTARRFFTALAGGDGRAACRVMPRSARRYAAKHGRPLATDRRASVCVAGFEYLVDQVDVRWRASARTLGKYGRYEFVQFDGRRAVGNLRYGGRTQAIDVEREGRTWRAVCCLPHQRP